MRLHDWRLAPPDRIGPLLDAEYGWWRRELGWNLARSWDSLEPARQQGRVPGFLVEDPDGRVRGWAFFVRNHETIQIGSIVAAEPRATGELLEAILGSPEAADATAALSFTRAQAPGLEAALVAQGFAVEPYRYLALDVSAQPPPGTRASFRPWTPSDLVATVDLVARAYADSTELRPFAPTGGRGEWIEYVGQLVTLPACGVLLPWASALATARDAGTLDGAVLVTAIDEATAHIAQIAVDPVARGRGLGQALVSHAIAAVAERGFTRVTLLVAGSNTRAAALYDRLGFVESSRFLAGLRR